MPTVRVNVLVSQSPLGPGPLAQLLRAELRESDRDPSVLALRFTLQQRNDGAFSLLDDGAFGLGVTVALELEPPGGVTQRLFEGVVTHLRPHYEPILANSFVEILAMDAAVLLDAEERVVAWPNVKDSDVVSQVLAGYQIPADVDDTAVLYDEDDQRLTQRDTDWRFLQYLAERNGACFYFEYDPGRSTVVARFGLPDVSGQPQPDLVILQDDANLNWADVQLTATGPVSAGGAAYDPLAKQVVRADAGPALATMGADDAGEAVASGLTAAGATGSRALLRDPFPLDEAVTAAATAATDEARMVAELRAELDPALYRGLLRARRTVLLRGAGQRFSGTWYVRSVRTTLDGGELLQSLVAVRNATGLTGAESFGSSAEEVPAS